MQCLPTRGRPVAGSRALRRSRRRRPRPPRLRAGPARCPDPVLARRRATRGRSPRRRPSRVRARSPARGSAGPWRRRRATGRHWPAPAAARARTTSWWWFSSRGCTSTRRAASSAACCGWPCASWLRAAAVSWLTARLTTRARSTVSQASKASLRNVSPASSSSPSPGSATASTHVPRSSTSTSITVPTAGRSSTGSPPSCMPGPRERRSWARVHRSAPSGSSAPSKSIDARRWREIGRLLSASRASSAQLFWPRTGTRWPSVVISGRPSRRTVVVMVGSSTSSGRGRRSPGLDRPRTRAVTRVPAMVRPMDEDAALLTVWPTRPRAT